MKLIYILILPIIRFDIVSLDLTGAEDETGIKQGAEMCEYICSSAALLMRSDQSQRSSSSYTLGSRVFSVVESWGVPISYTGKILILFTVSICN